MLAVVAPAPALAPTTGTAAANDAGLRRLIRESRGHGLWIAAWSLIGWVGTGLAPALTDRPFLIMMLSPRALFAALAVDSVSIGAFVVLGTVRLGVTDASYFLLGRKLPENYRERPLAASGWRRRLGSAARRSNVLATRLCRRPALAGSVLFFRPNGKYLAIAGAKGVSPLVAAVASMLGTACFLVALHLGMTSIT